ncbi:Serine/threonine protein kinase [Syntrophobacter sp. SbD1]|nr:Serine/threonine protein kinase [Syntrophobacter sp. SbD1]
MVEPVTQGEFQAADPIQFYDYGIALMDGQFWEEAIQELNMAASLGFRRLKCWEYCGDCASKLGKWDDAFRFYEYVYSDADLADEPKKAVLAKISKCSQAQRKDHAGTTATTRQLAKAQPEEQQDKPELISPSVLSITPHSVDAVIGRTAISWPDRMGRTLDGCTHSYRVAGLLHIGASSLIVELEEQASGKKFAGQAFSGKLADALPAEKLALWAKRQMLINSRHLVRIYDLASIDGRLFIVREHLPLSLNDLFAAGVSMPISLAVRLGHQLLEALGDLHLHMASDGRIQNLHHLDLRPSRVLLRRDKPYLKVYNGGLWKEMEAADPAGTHLTELPLPHLSYRAPEQFRTYLARKRPPLFTDIYLFGTLFYEMLTGTPAFNASSYREYEIQHCEQYPPPPKVWRSEIPETLNELIMNCLACDPMRRFRSATQISLILEKSFPTEVARPRDDLYQRFLEKVELA